MCTCWNRFDEPIFVTSVNLCLSAKLRKSLLHAIKFSSNGTSLNFDIRGGHYDCKPRAE